MVVFTHGSRTLYLGARHRSSPFRFSMQGLETAVLDRAASRGRGSCSQSATPAKAKLKKLSDPMWECRLVETP